MDSALQASLAKKGLYLVKRIGKGHSSHVFLLKAMQGKLLSNCPKGNLVFPRAFFQKEKRLVAKAERPDSTRFKMAERESKNLEKANALGIGPKLYGFDLEKKVILMEYIEGIPFSEWLFSGPKKKELAKFIKELLRQADALDKAGLDHGQLQGKGKNILARKGKPVIIDFEKASLNRKCHNLSVIQGFLFKNPNGAVAKKVKEMLENGTDFFNAQNQLL